MTDVESCDLNRDSSGRRVAEACTTGGISGVMRSDEDKF